MRSVYRVIAYIIAAEVVVQAMAIAFAFFGLSAWVENGGTLTAAAMQDESISFTGMVGFAIHGIGGQMVVPATVLILLIVSLFAKVPGGIRWALYAVVSVIIQVALGMAAHGVPALGLLHGLFAFVLFTVAYLAARRAVDAATEPARAAAVAHQPTVA